MESLQASMISSQYQLQNNGDFLEMKTPTAGVPSVIPELTLYYNNFETIIKHRSILTKQGSNLSVSSSFIEKTPLANSNKVRMIKRTVL
jgi:hypothetical protein